MLYIIIDVRGIQTVALGRKLITYFVLLLIAHFASHAQSIVIDTSSTSKYLIKKPDSTIENDLANGNNSQEDLSFSDRAMSIGKGILNRLKARLNLDEAAESLKEKKERFIGSDAEKPQEEDGS